MLDTYNNYVDLACAIIERATLDYKHHIRKTYNNTDAQKKVKKITDFFESENYKKLTDVNNKWLLNAVREQVRNNEDIKDERKRKKMEVTTIMQVKYDEGAYPITKAHKQDAGYDIKARNTQTIKAKGSAVFRTGVHVAIPKGCAGILISKSGLNVNHSIISDGLIDEGYNGEIVVKLYNLGRVDYKVNAGDKITQLVITPVIDALIEPVEHLDGGERGSNGFGSSGR